MTVSWRWSVFWFVLGCVALGGEMVALILNGATDSLSAQVWFVLDLSPVVWSAGLVLFVGGGAWLLQHFFWHSERRGTMTKYLIGHGVPPALVGAVRGALIGGAIAVVEALISYFTTASLPGVGWMIAAPIIAGGLRTVEGTLDSLKQPPPDPTKAELAVAVPAVNNPAP